MPLVSLGTLPYIIIGPWPQLYSGFCFFSWFRLIGTMPRLSWTLFWSSCRYVYFECLKIVMKKEEKKWKKKVKVGTLSPLLFVNACQSFDNALSMIFMELQWSPIPNKWLLIFIIIKWKSLINYKKKKLFPSFFFRFHLFSFPFHFSVAPFSHRKSAPIKNPI